MELKTIKVLIAIPSPRDIEIVQKAQDTIPSDKLIVKYYYKYHAMSIISNFFADHKEYTHLAIKPDDLVATKEHYEILKEELEKNDHPILGGLCNANMLSGVHKLGICETQIPSIRRYGRQFRKVDIRELDKIIEKQGTKVIQVAFAGLPFMFIRRDILEKIKLEGDGKYNDIPESNTYQYGQSYDVVFCNKLKTAGIPIKIHTDVKMLHLKFSAEAERKLVGIKEPYILLIKDNEKTDITNEYQPTLGNITPKTYPRSNKISIRNN